MLSLVGNPHHGSYKSMSSFHSYFTGHLIGHFYDKSGQPTENLKDFHKRLKEAKSEKKSDEDDRQRFPPCNFAYTQGKGRRLWCSELRYTVKLLNFRMSENFVVIYLNFKQRGQSLGYFIKNDANGIATVKTLIRLLL